MPPRKKTNDKSINKSQSIRDMLAAHPEAKVKEIVSLLADKGVPVKAQLVYFIKSTTKAKRRKQARQKAVATADHTARTTDHAAIPIELLVAVRSLADQAGGIGRLKQIVDVLAE